MIFYFIKKIKARKLVSEKVSLLKKFIIKSFESK